MDKIHYFRVARSTWKFKMLPSSTFQLSPETTRLKINTTRKTINLLTVAAFVRSFLCFCETTRIEKDKYTPKQGLSLECFSLTDSAWDKKTRRDPNRTWNSNQSGPNHTPPTTLYMKLSTWFFSSQIEGWKSPLTPHNVIPQKKNPFLMENGT